MIELILFIVILVVAMIVIIYTKDKTIRLVVAIGALIVGFALLYYVAAVVQPVVIQQTFDPELNSAKNYSVITVETDALTPEQVRSVYLPTMYRNRGAGMKVAIISCFKHKNAQADFDKFCAKYDLPQKQLVIKSFGTVANSGWATETCLDTQWSHVFAPQAETHLIEAANNSYSAIKQALTYANTLGLNVVSMSFGSSESQAVIDYLDPVFTQNLNTIFMASSGDNFDVCYPSSSSNVISVGGTTILVAPDGINNRTTPREADYTGAARSFRKIGETTWAARNGWGGGYGISRYVDSPTYQTGVTHCVNRTTPDLSLSASAAGGRGFSIICNGKWSGVIGTSVSCPIFAGTVATINSARQTPLTRIQLMTFVYGQIPLNLAVETSVGQSGFVGRSFVDVLVSSA